MLRRLILAALGHVLRTQVWLRVSWAARWVTVPATTGYHKQINEGYHKRAL